MELKEENYPFLREPLPIKDQNWDPNIAPLLSIDCKTYMHEKYIHEAIDSFLMQETTFRVEIVIHDDASTDRTQEIIGSYIKKYPGLFKATFQIENQYKKPKTSKYIMPHKIQSRYIAKCEGDDYWTDPSKLQKQVNFLEQNPNFVATYHDAIVIDDCGKVLSDSRLATDGISYKRFENAHELMRDFTSYELLMGSRMLLLSICFRNVIGELPDEATRAYTGDVFLFMLFGEHGCAKYLGDTIQPAVYRRHEGGVSYGLLNQNFIEEQYVWRLKGFTSLIEMFLYQARTTNYDIALNFLFKVVYPRMMALRSIDNPVKEARRYKSALQKIKSSYRYKIGRAITFVPHYIRRLLKSPWQQISAVKSSSARKYISLAKDLYKSGQYQKSMKLCLLILKKNKQKYLPSITGIIERIEQKSPQYIIETRLKSLYTRGDQNAQDCIQFLQAGKYERAKRVFSTIINKNPGSRNNKTIWRENFDLIHNIHNNIYNNENIDVLKGKIKSTTESPIKKILLLGLPKSGTDTLYSLLKETPNVKMMKARLYILDGPWGLYKLFESYNSIEDFKISIFMFFFIHIIGNIGFSNNQEYFSIIQARLRLKNCESKEYAKLVKTLLLCFQIAIEEGLEDGLKQDITEIVFRIIVNKKAKSKIITNQADEIDNTLKKNEPYFYVFDRCIEAENLSIARHFQNTDTCVFFRDPRSNYLVMNKAEENRYGQNYDIESFIEKYSLVRQELHNQISEDNTQGKIIGIGFERFLLNREYRYEVLQKLQLGYVKTTHYRYFAPSRYFKDIFNHELEYDNENVKLIRDRLSTYCLGERELLSYPKNRVKII
jgi:hypothetical protein